MKLSAMHGDIFKKARKKIKIQNPIYRFIALSVLRILRDMLSLSVVSVPLVILFIFLNWPQPPFSLIGTVIASIYLFATIPRFFDGWFFYELIILSLAPSIRNLVFMAMLWSWRIFKEARLARPVFDNCRSLLLADLGFDTRTRLHTKRSFAWGAIILMWLMHLLRSIGLMGSELLGWFLIWVLITGYASILLSPHVVKSSLLQRIKVKKYEDI